MEHPLSLPKLRNLDKYGVITDVDPFDLPLGAWSMALNVRFENGRVSSAPVWRAVGNPLSNTSPRFVFVANKADSSTSIYVCNFDGTVIDWTPNAETDVSITGFTTNEAEAQWTGAALAGVVYLNREDRHPWCLKPTDSIFSEVPLWDSGWHAKIIRAYAGALATFNITKDGVRYPTMVKTSDIVADPGVPPPSWDATDATTNAVENPLTEMNGEIVEAQQLGNAMIIYSNQETWQMAADGSDDVYSFRPLPFSKGAIGTNCVVEVDNQHYVFGADDIWKHDGLSSESIADAKVRKFVFNTLNAKQSDRFFASYNPSKKTISFNYVSGDAYVVFNGKGCNRAAVYHIPTGTWTFDDVPLAFASGYAKVSLQTQTWTNVTGTWATAGGTWQDLEDGFKRTLVYVGENASGLTARVYARDDYGQGSNLSSDVDTVATRPGMLLREGIDLDELDAELRGYKVLLALWPQGRLDPSAAPMSFTVGATDYPSVPYVYDPAQTYDTAENYKLDFQAAGRFLSLRMDYHDYKTMSLSGFDFDIDTTGSR